MTAPEHICGPSCTPDCGMGRCYLTDGPHQHPKHAHKPSEQANEQALRDRIRDTIHAASPTCPTYHPHECHPCTYRASLIMSHAVQPALDAKDAQIAELRRQAELADTVTAKTKELLTRRTETLRRRAEAAEAALATQNAENDRLDQLLIDERATTARLGRELRDLRDRHEHTP